MEFQLRSSGVRNHKSCGELGLGQTPLGILGSEVAKVYHTWDGANVSRRSITNEGVPGALGVPVPYPPIYFATLSSSGTSTIPRSIII